MKTIIFTILLCVAINASAQTLTKKWRTDTLLRTPESVLWYPKAKVLFVACIDGKPDGKDGVGSIGKVSATGKIIDPAWVKGLNAPKGMGIHGNKLYVADIDEVAVIDINTAKITTRIPIEGSKFLNDITINDIGTVYVSDTGTGKIYTIINDKAALYFESTEFKGVNGLLATRNGLSIVDFGNGGTFTLSKQKVLKKTGETVEGADGIVATGNDTYLVSNWNGEIYYVDAANKATKLVDTKDQKLSSADIWYDAASSTVYVPTFFSNSVIAYTFKK